MELEKIRTEEIVTLHQEIIGHLKQSLEKAIRIGQLLSEQKESLKHGQFTPWLKGNVPFSDRTARNYMRLWHERDRIKTESVSDLSSAYVLLTEPKFDNTKALAEIDTRREYCKRTLDNLLARCGGSIQECSDIGLLKEVHDTGLKVERTLKQDNLVIQRRLGQLIIDLESFAYEYLTTDVYKAGPTGLKVNRPSTKEEWIEYGQRLQSVHEMVKTRAREPRPEKV